jgi:Cys-rich repeat protein
MNKNIKYVGYFILTGIISLFIWLIIHFTKSNNNKCTKDSDCPSGNYCNNGNCNKIISIGGCTNDSDCPSGNYCNNGNCNKIISIGGCTNDSDCPSGNYCNNGNCNKIISIGGCKTACGTDMYCNGNSCVKDNYLPILSQPGKTIQLANNTSDNFLHIFIQCNNVNQQWKKIGGDGTVTEPVNWGAQRDPSDPSKGNYAWDPPGAVILAEAIIPKNKYMLLQLPDDVVTFIMQPIKMKKSNNNTPLKLGDDIYSIIMKQTSLLFEATASTGGVADISGVNGVNFRVKYSVLTSKGVENMEIQKNPCTRVSDKFKMEVGCWSPVKQICGASPTADCKPGSQNCKFNQCSQTLFNIPDDLKKYIGNYDEAGGPNPPYNDYAKYPEYVKKFINQNQNLKQNSDQDNYCNDIQENSGDYTTYCYDYNDLGSSPVWVNPYKAKLVYFDL